MAERTLRRRKQASPLEPDAEGTPPIGWETPHPWVQLEHHREGLVQVDREMVPLIQTLWKLGIDTTYCCQGYPSGERFATHQGYIAFPDLETLSRFIQGVSGLNIWFNLPAPFGNDSQQALFFDHADLQALTRHFQKLLQEKQGV